MKELRERYPELLMIVAGDLNQSRDGSGWYGTHSGRAMLSDALQGAGLVCVTDADLVASGQLAQQLVDHICVTADHAGGARVSCWNRFDSTGQRLSDHPTVAVDLDLE